MENKKDLENRITILKNYLNDYQAALMSLMECIQFMPPEAPCLPELRKDFDDTYDRIVETQIRLQNSTRELLALKKNG